MPPVRICAGGAGKPASLPRPDCDRYAESAARSDDLRACREALKTYFAGLKLGLIEKRISALDEEWARQNAQVRRLEERKDAQLAEEHELKSSIAENGGDRIERLGEDIRQEDIFNFNQIVCR